MPETTNISELQWHPSCGEYEKRQSRISACFDFSLSETEQFRIPTSHTKWAFNEAGEKQRHYIYDERLIQARDTLQVLWFTSKKAAEMRDFKYSFRMQCFMKEDNRDFYGTERILNYHSNARVDYTLPEDTWKVGVEVEKEERSLQRNESVWKLFQETGWAKENDSSLGDGGFELISPILPLWDRARLKKAMRPVKKYLNAGHSDSCGGHINVSCKGKSSKEVLQALKAGAALLYAIYQPRMQNRYCPVRQWDRYISAPDKYSAFYLKSEQICEIRLFPAVKSMNNLIWRLDLIRWLIEINQSSFVKKIVSLNNRNSYLSCHLRKIYSEDKIKNVAQRAIKHYQKWVGTFTTAEKATLEAAGFVVDPSRISDEVVRESESSELEARPARRSARPRSRNADLQAALDAVARNIDASPEHPF